MDFLTGRRFQVELGDATSSVLDIDRGCVQGSVLGPKLFSLYLSELENRLGCDDVQIISYADDTYVIISCETATDTVNKAERTIIEHVEYLKSLGMTVNESKTEVMWIAGTPCPILEFKIGNEKCKLVEKIKALGIFIQNDLSWDTQAEQAILKGKKLVSNFTVLRRYLNEDQFLKAASANYFGAVFYAAGVWFDSSKGKYKDKLQSLHFRLLRTATRDYQMRLTHDQLSTRCRRATPRQRTNFITASRVIKTFRVKQPPELHKILLTNYFEEPRFPGVGLFFDSSMNKKGQQSIENRLLFMRSIKTPWNTKR